MKKNEMKYHISVFDGLADLHTPVSIFLKLRDHFSQVFMLESSDYSGTENSQSMLCCDLQEEINVKDGIVSVTMHSNHQQYQPKGSIIDEINQFIGQIHTDREVLGNGVFGYTNFDAIKYFEHKLHIGPNELDTADIRYGFFRYVIIIDHFYDTLRVIENIPQGSISQMSTILGIINRQDARPFKFHMAGDISSNMEDERFKEIVGKCKSHCQRGDVFQVVPSRRFEISFKGDEIMVYRHLRSINPSPYLFYFDYGSYRIFGSSPEAQIKIQDQIAEIHPIAGTVRRTGNTTEDIAAATRLLNDPKENAEHIMLVDLARNDLSKKCSQVEVFKYREIQYFSHVIHLTSIVKGKLDEGVSPYNILADTFPAGTLSGAPKHRALQIIEEVEPCRRGFYGGGIGMIGLNGSLNHAIMIRSFFSYKNILTFQAGAGVVILSDQESELQEVNNKLGALRKAIDLAHQTI